MVIFVGIFLMLAALVFATFSRLLFTEIIFLALFIGGAILIAGQARR